MSSGTRAFFILECAYNRGIVSVVLRGHEWGRSESSANRSGRHSLLSWYNNERTWARTDEAARPCLLSPPSASLKRKLPVLVKDAGPPSSAAVSSGHLPPREAFSRARLGRPLPCNFNAERLTAASPDNKRKPYGAPSALRRGKAGAPLLKGQKPDIALRSCGQPQMGQMTSTRQEPSIRRSLHVAFPPMAVQQQRSTTPGFCSFPCQLA